MFWSLKEAAMIALCYSRSAIHSMISEPASGPTTTWPLAKLFDHKSLETSNDSPPAVLDWVWKIAAGPFQPHRLASR
jgi:hypothetical protein